MSEDVIGKSWRATMRAWLRPQPVSLFFLGFAAGIPILLIFSTLSVWLREAGVTRSAVTFFSWAALGYSFKFLWAPLVDLLPLPFLTRILGRRRGWMFFAQLMIILSILLMSSVNPGVRGHELFFMAIGAVMLGFSSATQDIVIDAYRIECAEESLQALLASMYIAGYRMGMLVAGAGSLFFAGWLGTNSQHYFYGAWQKTYWLMALMMGIGLVTTLIISEPERRGKRENYHFSVGDYARLVILFLVCATSFALTFFYGKSFFSNFFGDNGEGFFSFFVGGIRFFCALGAAALVAYLAIVFGLVSRQMVRKSYVEPVADFFVRYGLHSALLVLLLVGFYRLSDIVLGVISNVFYLDMGFSKNAIAGVTKTFGLGMTLVGGFLGGMLTVRFGVNRILMLGAVLSAATNLLFMLLAGTGPDLMMLTVVIGADNLAAGIATTAFVAFLSTLTSVSFTAVQYAILSSVMTLMPKLIGGYSGTMVAQFGYEHFFLLTALMGLPVMLLVWIVGKELKV